MDRNPLHVVEVRTTEALQSLRVEWDALVERCPRATLYQTFDWNEAWWRAFRLRKRLCLLAVRTGSELVGIAPFYVSRHLGTPLRRLAFLGTGCSDYMDLIAEESRAGEVWDAVVRHLSPRSGYDLADLQHLSPNSVLRCLVEPRMAQGDNAGAALKPQ